ncbi:hypothetical protein NGI46_10750 [Peribacillus butanolivorans]|nr:hypothetical protein [Peribacillus butanolivorans]
MSSRFNWYLSGLGVRLVALDHPSVDPLNSKELSVHHETYRCLSMINKENELQRMNSKNNSLCRMPDILSIGLGGGTQIRETN